MTTTKIGHGLAVQPDADLALFARMARQGKHLDGVARLGHGWSFTDGPPEDAVFDLAYESNPSSDYFDIFKAAGWTPVLSLGDVHIFKAVPGTVPLHTGMKSRRDELARNRNRYLVYAALAIVACVLVFLGLRAVSWNAWLEIAIQCVFIVPVAYTVIPLIGYWRLLRKASDSR